EGMILAEDEVGIGLDHAGIMVLPRMLEPGTALASVLPLASDVLELEITPNRPDCLGVYGVARELHAATGAPLAPPPWADDPGVPGPLAGAAASVECPELCPRFTARVFEGVAIGPSPAWLKARLMAAGQRPINNVVDITNYVMLLTGQPLHAFDLQRVSGGRLNVRRARDGETVQTLDGSERVLDGEMVVIEDEDGPTSIAGVMGGARSEVSAETTEVLLEAATWDGPNINRTSTALGLRSEASGRFEKGLAPEQALHGLIMASILLCELTGANLAPGTIDVGGPGPAAATLPLRASRVRAILGIDVPAERQREILTALDFGVADAGDGLTVTVPALRRRDVTREIDVIEEVARLYGLERLPATLPARRGAYGRLSPAQRLRRRAADALVGRGLYEVVGWSFTDPGLADRLRLPAEDPRREAVVIENPLSEDQSRLRTTVLGSLLDQVQHNAARGNVDVALFEIGGVYRAGEPLPHEHRALGVALCGRVQPPTWGVPDPPPADLFALKAVLEALLDALGAGAAELAPSPEPFLHPGRSAVIGQDLGWIGELHPLVAAQWDLDRVVALELDLDRLLAGVPAERTFEDLISFPALRQDLAVVVEEAVPAARVLEVVRRAGGALLREARVFDVYRGTQVGEGRRSLALALAFRAADRTLRDEDVAPVRRKIVAALQSELGGELRG
ncbi:MAG TPA: phenylalanine--tRNA ligase subunit beta, partial [Solirubrobacteraceae bacterium]|nr:phenylalanine--tRNA ligase subunit beta [Solirubrobacteraceae bacterium]